MLVLCTGQVHNLLFFGLSGLFGLFASFQFLFKVLGRFLLGLLLGRFKQSFLSSVRLGVWVVWSELLPLGIVFVIEDRTVIIRLPSS